MNSNNIINLIAIIIILIPIFEIITGNSLGKLGIIKRNEKPFSYWFSVLSKLIVGIIIFNLEYFQSILGK